MNRLHNLDYLRGAAASGIMLYHFSIWTSGEFPAESFMGRVGIYGVSIFYVLSGLTLFHVYWNKMKPSASDLRLFFRKRAFRILPLLWLVTIASLVLGRRMPDPLDLALNLTGLFGFVKWDAYFSAGVWSIGNELVFYVFFPFFILFARRWRPALLLTTLAIFGIYLYFAFGTLTPARTLSAQWRDYINPLNQVFLFLGGFLIGFLAKNLRMPGPGAIALLIGAMALFIFYPASGDPIQLVTGGNRLVFTLCCFLVCLAIFKIEGELPNLLHRPLALLGEISYSVYLAHPLVYNLSQFVFNRLEKWFHLAIPAPAQFALRVAVSLVAAYFIYQYFEKPFMKLGAGKKHKAEKKTQPVAVEN